MMRKVVIVGGTRTAIGSYGGALSTIPVAELGAIVLRESLKKSGLRPVSSEECINFAPHSLTKEKIELELQYMDYDPDLQPVQIDQVLMGNVLGAGQGQNVARQAMIRAGIAKETPATAINKLCGSGMEAVAMGCQAIRCGDADVVLAGGMENMSQVPYGLPTTRWGQRMGDGKMIDLMVHDGLYEMFYGYHMGITAENIASLYNISRSSQDELGVLSHNRAVQATRDGIFAQEIVPVSVPQRKGAALLFERDERPMETDLEKMGRLRPAFTKDGTVTAGNASGINDGAACLILMSEEKANQLGLKILATISDYAAAGLDPAYMGLGPVPAIRKIMARNSYDLKDMDRIELNEAFAAQAIGCMQELDLSPENTNLLGSGISLGHPIGCTGARILLTLIGQMNREELELGLASLCIGGGQGMAMVLKNR